MDIKLVAGKRYMWPTIANVPSSRMVNGLFTGEYNKVNGNAILMTRNGDTWEVPPQNCKEIPRRIK